MLDLLKLVVPIFISVDDYQKMRQKMASFVFYNVYAMTFFLRRMGDFGSGFKALENQILSPSIAQKYPVLLDINLLGIVIAFVISLVTYIFHFHDRVSDAIGLRSKFDIDHIVQPLASEVGVSLDDAKLSKISDDHDRVMSNVFYKYTSSTGDNKVVDRHDVIQALDSWSWFWIALEATTLWVIAAVISILLGSLRGAFWFAIMVAVGVMLMFSLKPLLRRRAKAQIDKIADNPTAHQEVATYLNAL